VAYAAAGAISAELALGFNGIGFQTLFDVLPPFRTLRVPSRSIAYLRERRVELLLVHSAYYITGNVTEDVNPLRRRSDIDWVGEFPAPNGHVTDVFRIRPSSTAG
jgi:hypothetical protein